MIFKGFKGLGGEVWVTKVWKMLQACDASHFPTKISIQWYRDWIRRSFVGRLQGVIWSEAVSPYDSATVVG